MCRGDMGTVLSNNSPICGIFYKAKHSVTLVLVGFFLQAVWLCSGGLAVFLRFCYFIFQKTKTNNAVLHFMVQLPFL